MTTGKKNWVLFALIFLTSVVSDQWTKMLAVNHLKGKPAIEWFSGNARLVYAENPGAFLGLGGNWPDALRFSIFIVLAIVLLAGVLVYMIKKRDLSTWSTIGLALFSSGALGNVIDRVARDGGRVVDFMQLSLGDVSLFGLPMRTGIFNIADIALMAAIPVLFFATKDEPKKNLVPSKGEPPLGE